MLGLGLFIDLLVIVFAILNLILFFKIWGMTNNTKQIRMLLEKHFEETPEKKVTPIYHEPTKKFEVGETVIVKEDGSKKVVDYKRNGKYFLRDGSRSYTESELEKI